MVLAMAVFTFDCTRPIRRAHVICASHRRLITNLPNVLHAVTIDAACMLLLSSFIFLRLPLLQHTVGKQSSSVISAEHPFQLDDDGPDHPLSVYTDGPLPANSLHLYVFVYVCVYLFVQWLCYPYFFFYWNELGALGSAAFTKKTSPNVKFCWMKLEARRGLIMPPCLQ